MRLYYSILVLIISFQIEAQVDTTFSKEYVITQEVFDSLKSFTEYPETKKTLVLRNELEPKTTEPKNLEIPGLRYLIITIAILLLGFVLLVILSKIKNNKEVIIPHKTLENIEDISEIDSDTLYNEAIKSGDLRLAIRIQFIKVLQILSKQKIIHWELDKTNRDYYFEINDKELQKTFKYLTLIYDNAWYGNKIVSPDIFNIYNEKFQSFINRYDGQ